MFKLFKSGLLLIAISIFTTNTQAQEKSVLYSEIEQAQTSGTYFTPFNLFNVIEGEKHDILNNETLLQPQADATTKLYETAPMAVTLTFNLSDGKKYTLNMMRSNPFASNPNLGYIDANGTHPTFTDKGIHYQGAVAGYEQSMAALSVFANGDVMAIFANEEGNFVIGKLEDNSSNYILYNDRDFKVVPPTICETVDDIPNNDEPGSGDKTTAAYQCNRLQLYWEIDYELYQNKQSSTSLTQTYITGLFNNIQALYRNERIVVELKTVFIWTVNDNYADGASQDALLSFQDSWNNKGDNFDGDLAMLLARDAGGLGGIAYRGILCNRQLSYAYGDVNGAYLSVPTYSWDVSMVTHELGHNIASRHTHWCGWNTGAGGSCGSIDNCTTQENGSSCNTCPATFNNSQSANSWQGTIMSYCHLTSRGVNLANGFGPLPGNVLRTAISNSQCLKTIITGSLVPKEICKGAGQIGVVFDTAAANRNWGTPPYTYNWTSGGNTQFLNVTSPGAYEVTVVDSNGCSRTFSGVVTSSTADSCKLTGSNVYDIEKQYVSMYPNPAHDKVMLKYFSSSVTNMSVKITDLTGRTIRTEQTKTLVGENNLMLNVAGMQSGMYYILLSSPTEQYIGLKLVVE